MSTFYQEGYRINCNIHLYPIEDELAVVWALSTLKRDYRFEMERVAPGNIKVITSDYTTYSAVTSLCLAIDGCSVYCSYNKWKEEQPERPSYNSLLAETRAKMEDREVQREKQASYDKIIADTRAKLAKTTPQAFEPTPEPPHFGSAEPLKHNMYGGKCPCNFCKEREKESVIPHIYGHTTPPDFREEYSEQGIPDAQLAPGAAEWPDNHLAVDDGPLSTMDYCSGCGNYKTECECEGTLLYCKTCGYYRNTCSCTMPERDLPY
jgi:hypothetical protein